MSSSVIGQAVTRIDGRLKVTGGARYDAKRPVVRLDQIPTPTDSPKEQYQRGDAETAFQQAPIKLDATYVTPVETHNAMEMHATIAVWDKSKEKIRLYESSQGVVNHRNVASQVLGLPQEAIEVISPFIGSGFGSKLVRCP